MKLQEIIKYPLMFAPLTSKSMEKYMDRVDSLFRKYKPLMEQKTGVRMIDVKIERKKPQYSLDRLRHDLACADSISRKKELLSLWLWDKLYTLIKHDTQVLAYCAGGPEIIVPAGLNTKANHLGIENTLDQCVVHELTHHLWYTNLYKNIDFIEEHAKDSNFSGTWVDKKEEKNWGEGFASFGELEWFKDLYPNDYKIKEHSFLTDSCYKKGKKKVEDVLKVYGKDALLRIPFEWPAFENELKSRYRFL